MAKLFLMRWNPAISSYKLEAYHSNCKKFPDGFRIDWSVWSHDEAQAGDYFAMMRVGSYRPGIVFYGVFVSDPYTDKDWAGTDHLRHYVLMNCFGFTDNDESIIPAEELTRTIPEEDWMHGHSGVVLPDDVAGQLTRLLNERVPDFSYNPDPIAPVPEDSFEGAKMLPELMKIFADLSPSIHTYKEDEYDWLEPDEEWSQCLLIPNPTPDGSDIEVETGGEFTLYFAGAHTHYDNDPDGYLRLVKDLIDITTGKMCAYSCMYEDVTFSAWLDPVLTREEVEDKYIRKELDFNMGIVALHTDTEIKPDGIYSIDMEFFDPAANRAYTYRLNQLTDKVPTFRAQQTTARRIPN